MEQKELEKKILELKIKKKLSYDFILDNQEILKKI